MRALIWAAVSTKVQANEDEKYSLTAQESDARTLCIQNDWAIVEVLSVPGHSRRYVDIHECAADMRQQGIDAFDRLLTLWDSSGFDVLIVRDGDRFARTQALHAYVTERTIDTGARIYSLSDGWIDRDNYRMWIAMSGYKAASDVDRLVKAHDAGMIKRAQRGLPAPAVPLSHRPLLDDRGKVIGIAVDESKRNLFDDLADLLLAGVSWHDIPGQLYERGHASPAGGYFGNATLWRILYNPLFWGHSAVKFHTKTRFLGGIWSFDPSEPPPTGVQVFYDTHPPVYTGDRAEAVKAELRRRKDLKGRANPYRSLRFTGLVLCGECGYLMTYSGYKNHFLRCKSHSVARYDPNRQNCEQRALIHVQVVQSFFDAHLREMIVLSDPSLFLPDQSSAANEAAARLQALAAAITDVELRIRRLIQAQSAADGQMYQYYTDEIKTLGLRLKALQEDHGATRRASLSSPNGEGRQVALDEVLKLSVDLFWEQPDTYINQILRRLMGSRRLVVLAGEIIGTAEKPRR